jgi:hypothetical protein
VRLAVLPAFVGAHPDLVDAFPTHVAGIDGSNKPVLNVQSSGAGVLAALRVAFAYSADL